MCVALCFGVFSCEAGDEGKESRALVFFPNHHDVNFKFTTCTLIFATQHFEKILCSTHFDVISEKILLTEWVGVKERRGDRVRVRLRH